MSGHGERAHALLSASGASRWLACTPAPRLEEKIDIQETSSPYALEGTLAHELGELEILKAESRVSKQEYHKLVKAIRANEHYDLDMEHQVAKYTDYVLEEYYVALSLNKSAKLLVEERFSLQNYIPEGFGTNDAMVISDGVLEVIDLKYGKGVAVSADNNPQLKLYGLGALDKYDLMYDIHTVKLTIVQPRLDSISSSTLSAQALKHWGKEVVRPKAKEAHKGKGDYVPGDHCRWCKAKPRCRALSEENLKLAKKDFSVPDLLTDEEVVEVFEQLPTLTSWADSVKSFMLSEALKGKVWEGYKLVADQSQRKWADPDKTEKSLLEMDYDEKDILTKKLQGITAIEKLVGKVKFSELSKEHVVKPLGSPTLVPESDKRQPYGKSSAKQDFEN